MIKRQFVSSSSALYQTSSNPGFLSRLLSGFSFNFSVLLQTSYICMYKEWLVHHYVDGLGILFKPQKQNSTLLFHNVNSDENRTKMSVNQMEIIYSRLLCSKCPTPINLFRPVSIQVQLNPSRWSMRHKRYSVQQHFNINVKPDTISEP